MNGLFQMQRSASLSKQVQRGWSICGNIIPGVGKDEQRLREGECGSEGRTFQAERQPVQRLGIRAKSAMYRTAQEPGWTGAVEGSEAGSWRG